MNSYVKRSYIYIYIGTCTDMRFYTSMLNNEIICWRRYCVRKCISHSGLCQYRKVNPVCDSHFQCLIIIPVRGDSLSTVAHTTDHFYNAVLSRADSVCSVTCDSVLGTSNYPFMAHFLIYPPKWCTDSSHGWCDIAVPVQPPTVALLI